MISVLNHLSLVDCTTVKPAQERPGAAGGIRCPRPQVQLPFVSWYATRLSLSEASISIASLRSIDGSSTVSLVIAMLRFPHLCLDIVESRYYICQRLLYAGVVNLLLCGVYRELLDLVIGSFLLRLHVLYLRIHRTPVNRRSSNAAQG